MDKKIKRMAEIASIPLAALTDAESNEFGVLWDAAIVEYANENGITATAAAGHIHHKINVAKDNRDANNQ